MVWDCKTYKSSKASQWGLWVELADISILISNLHFTKVCFLLSFLSTSILYHPSIPVLVLSLFYRQEITFLGTNLSSKSIMWSHIFLIGIFSLAFFSKTLIHLWNYSGPNFFTSSSDLATFSSLSQISHSFTTFFISIIFYFFYFFFFSFFFFLLFLFFLCLFLLLLLPLWFSLLWPPLLSTFIWAPCHYYMQTLFSIYQRMLLL